MDPTVATDAARMAPRIWPITAIGVPAAVMALAGLNLLFTTGGSSHPQPTRAPGLADLFAGSTWLNWVAFVVFVGCALAIDLLGRRARHTENGSAA
jgi:hypothetical protein